MPKRLPKEKLETDPLLTGYYLLISFVKRNLFTVIALSVAVILLIGGGISYYLHSQAQEQEARELIVQAEKAFHQGEYDIALWGDHEEVRIGLVEIINNYGRTQTGNLALYYAAVSKSNLGNYEEALSYIRQHDPPEGIIGVGPLSFHAVILLNLDKYEEAADIFIKAAEWDINESTTPQNLLNAAQASMEAGDHARAIQLVDRILSEYEDTHIVDQARKLEGMLTTRQ